MSDLLPYLAPYSGWTLILTLFLLGLHLARRCLFPKLNPARRTCPHCHYDLRFSPTPTCSECGQTLKSESQAQRPPRKYLLAALSLLLATALPTYTIQHRVRQYGWSYYLTLYPLYYFFPNITDFSAQSGPYDIRIYHDRRHFSASSLLPVSTAAISRDGQVIWTWSDQFLHAGWHRRTLGGTALPPIVDLDADGTPELILSSFDSLRILRLGETLQSLTPPNSRDLAFIDDLIDLDQDGKLEAVAHDSTLTLHQTSFHGTTYPPYYYRIDRAGLHLAPDLMRTAELPIPLDYLQATAIDCRRFVLPPNNNPFQYTGQTATIAKPILTLIYSGHYTQAMTFLDQAWSGDESSKALFLQFLDQEINRSPAKPALYQLGYHPPPRTLFPPTTP